MIDGVLTVLSVLDLVGRDQDFLPDFGVSDPPELSRAYDAATQAVETDPTDAGAYYLRAVVCQQKRWYAEALADFGEVVRLHPDHAKAWLLISEILTSLGEYDKAKTARRQAQELDPNVG